MSDVPRNRVEVDHGLCEQSGLCARIAPDVFELRDDLLVIHEDRVAEADPSLLLEAEAVCPTQAIHISPL